MSTTLPPASGQVERVTQVLRAYRARPQNELDIQLGLAAIFDEHGVVYQREVVLTQKDRIDFLVGTLGIEIKLQGSRHQVFQQLTRYLAHERIGEVMLFTTKSQLRVMPTHHGQKRIHVFYCSTGI
jgi:hypothetical protein